MGRCHLDQEMGCGLIGGIFRRWSSRQQKKLVHSLSTKSTNYALEEPVISPRKPPKEISKKPRGKGDNAFLEAPKVVESTPNVDQKNASRTHHLALPGPPRKPEGRSGSREANSIQGKALVRSTSSNIMLPRQLGNLRHQETASFAANNSHGATVRTVDYLERSLHPEVNVNPSPRPRNGYTKLGGNVLMGNIVRRPSGEFRQGQGLMITTNITDPEALKNMGNDKYKQGRFEEALALYDQAIALDSGKATYRSNRSAALIGLGRLPEAVSECKAALRLDPCYQRAHFRLATLYVRLGEPVKALDHYKHSGRIAAQEQVAQAQALERHLKRCTEARMLREWSTLLKETELVISSGADSAPQVFAMQAEALLRLRRYQESYKAYLKRPNFGADPCSKLFGAPATSYMLTIEAQVFLAAGRFEEALTAAEQAARVDPSNKEANGVVKSCEAVSGARSSGNLLFKDSRFREACSAYSEGLEHDPYNPVLLCNRAACRIKLRHFEKAVEDCTTALHVLPDYAKARLRRADCYTKMEKWEASVQDYELLARGSPRDETVARALHYAQAQLKRKHGEYFVDLKSGSKSSMVKS